MLSTGSQREYTNIYRLFYLSPGQNTSHVVAEDQKRFLAMETLIFHLYSIFGNGVLNGWEIREELSGLNLIITAGSGHIGFKSAMTIADTAVELPITTNTIIGEDGLRFYIYAKETQYTSIDRSVDFFASTNLIPLSDPNFDAESLGLNEVGPCGIIGIGEVIVKEIEIDGVTTFVIENPTYEIRDTLGIFASLDRYIKNHLHVGGANQPSKVNLYRHVMGKLSGRHIEWINASLIKKGKISNDRLPAFDHKELMNIGILSHSEIDTLLELVINKMNGEDKHALGDISIANLLKLLAFLKHQYSTIDDTLINTIIYIPLLAKENDPLVDATHTTATVDPVAHEIRGIQASSMGSDYVSWDSKAEFEAVKNEGIDRTRNIVISNDGVSLGVPLNLSTVYSTTTMNAEDWITIVADLENNTSVVHNDEDGDINFTIDGNAGIFAIKYFLDPSSQYRQAQSWDGSTKLEFSIKLEADESEVKYDHGNIFFFLIGKSPIADPVYDGYINKSIPNPNGGSNIPINPGVLVLANKEYTDGYKHIRIEIDDNNFNPGDVQGIGFYTTMEAGWDGRYNFSFQINQPQHFEMIPQVSNYLAINDSSGFIDMYRYNDIYFNNYGDIIFIYTANQVVQWDNIFYNATLPTVDVGENPSISIKTSIGNTEAEALNGQFSPINPYDGSINQDNSLYIAIWVQLHGGGKTDKKVASPILHSLSLYYSVSSGDFSQQKWEDQDDWLNRATTYTNIAIDEINDYIKIANSNYVNTIYFIEKNSIKTIDENKLDISSLGSSGENMPASPIQSFYNLPNGFLEPKYVTKLTNSGYLIADTGNDRIVEVDATFNPVRIIQGNAYLSLIDRDLAWLTATYNAVLGQIALTFSQRIDLINFDLSKIVLTNGTNVLNLGNTLNAEAFMFGSALIGGENIDKNGLWSLDATYIPHIGTIRNENKQSSISGEVLLFNLTTAAKTQVNAWIGEKRIILNNNAYSNNVNSSVKTTIKLPEEFDRNNENFVNFGDFNNDGYITGISKLYDKEGDNSTILEKVVEEINIIYWDILAPCRVEVYNDYAYLISQPNKFSVVNLRYNGVPIWSIMDDIVRFAFYTNNGNNAYGGAKIINLEEDRMLIVSPVNNIIFEMIPTSNAVLNYKSTGTLTPVDAYKMQTGETMILVSDESALGANSRVYVEDNTGDVIYEWGLGKLRLPTGLQVLENGNILISC